jgi:hypothetical protein
MLPKSGALLLASTLDCISLASSLKNERANHLNIDKSVGSRKFLRESYIFNSTEKMVSTKNAAVAPVFCKVDMLV